MTVVLDASAVLALLYDEPGAEVVRKQTQGAQLLSVNLSEVLTRVIDKGGDPEKVKNLLDRLEIRVARFDEPIAVAAALLRNPTRHVGASLGDRACLAFSLASGLPVLTADQKWALLDLGIDIQMIR